jgi:hypothetical protein
MGRTPIDGQRQLPMEYQWQSIGIPGDLLHLKLRDTDLKILCHDQ